MVGHVSDNGRQVGIVAVSIDRAGASPRIFVRSQRHVPVAVATTLLWDSPVRQVGQLVRQRVAFREQRWYVPGTSLPGLGRRCHPDPAGIAPGRLRPLSHAWQPGDCAANTKHPLMLLSAAADLHALQTPQVEGAQRSLT